MTAQGFAVPKPVGNMKSKLYDCLIAACVMSLAGCPAKYREDLDYTYRVEQTVTLDEFPSTTLVQFESVDWDPEDCAELRALISDDNIAAGRNVLEIGTGTGVIAALCLSFGAKRVVATDPNPAAIANAVYRHTPGNMPIAVQCTEYLATHRAIGHTGRAQSTTGPASYRD